MAYSYTTINGQRVEAHGAGAFQCLAAAFAQHRFQDGQTYTLGITSGVRTRAEQEVLYTAWLKYLAGGPKAALAARPGTSRHEADGPAGPRAIDIHDSGAGAGVTVVGTERADYLRKIAPDYGFDPAGYRFAPREAWHYEYTRPLAGPIPTPPATVVSIEEDPMPERIPRTITRTTPQPVPRDWDWLRLNDAGDVTLVSGKGIVSATLSLQFHGLPSGRETQVRFFRSNPDDSSRDHAYPLTEIIGTSGDTFGQIGGNFELGSGDRLRVRLVCFDDDVIVVGGYASSLVWR